MMVLLAILRKKQKQKHSLFRLNFNFCYSVTENIDWTFVLWILLAWFCIYLIINERKVNGWAKADDVYYVQVVHGNFSFSLLNMEPDFDGSNLKGTLEWACSFSGCCLYF